MDTSTTSNASATRLSWCLLFLEIRLLILECIFPKNGHVETIVDRGFPKASSLATVCREWRYFFEKETFRRLAITSSDIAEFSRAVSGENSVRLNYISRLRYYIRLAQYTECLLDKPESAANIAWNNQAFTRAMVILLNALSSWDGTRGGLMLEITAYSPSDQIFHPLQLDIRDDYPLRFEEDLEKCPNYSEYYKKKKAEIMGSEAIRRPAVVRDKMAQRLRGTPLELRPWLVEREERFGNPTRSLAKVPIVRGLILRRSLLRGISGKALAKLFRESFVALGSFRLERWEGRTKEDDVAFLTDLQLHLMPNLPAGVQTFSLMQMKSLPNHRYRPTHAVLGPLSDLMAASCHRLANFYPPLELHAKTFLRQLALGGKQRGSRLKCLSLRANSLQPSTSQQSVTWLLTAASRAASKLPRLRVMELWNSGDGFGYLFRYTQEACRATIAWRSIGQNFDLEPQVIQVWSKVSRTRVLIVDASPFTEDEVGLEGFNYETILGHLSLRRLAFDPITEAQLAVMTRP
ncbi:hypothetical protein CEP51_006119 [Fusarium floridanum]|uniref:DUF6546 domain-containing protein n=1 Tax=Fusarium floridanum TaxID=1325733 RepID=A0A428RU33_9HYPO|nr:hypothetical protein CEP51_006119 [Fusarium floridanum]